jgi:predicted Fe-Mo cluster-binding NifX family protein
MKICVPVARDEGLASQVYGHFGSAPMFLLVDSNSGELRPLANSNQHHAHGMCQPLAALQGQAVDAVLVGGIGGGALSRLQAAGIKVYLARQGSLAEILEAFKAGQLPEASLQHACGGHGAGQQGCGHHH